MRKFVKVVLVTILFILALCFLAIGPLAKLDVLSFNFNSEPSVVCEHEFEENICIKCGVEEGVEVEIPNQFILGNKIREFLKLEKVANTLGLQNFTAICSFISGALFVLGFVIIGKKSNKSAKPKFKSGKYSQGKSTKDDSIKIPIPEPMEREESKIKF